MDEPDFFSQLADGWLSWEGVPGLLVIVLGVVLIFFVPLFVHQRGRQQDVVSSGFALHAAAELLAILGLVLLLFGLSYYADLPELLE